jgi:UDP-N-acetylglucosamine 2-epimerase (non-hydrolysing)
MKELLAVVGTRSELARLAPALRVLRDQYASVIRPRLMHTGEKTQMVWSTGALFGLVPERQHALSEDTMTFADLTWQISNGVGHELDSRKADLVLVQGSSMSAMLAAQQAFLRNIPVVHVDSVAGQFAGSLSSFVQSNRRMLSAIASFHCVPDREFAETLRLFGYPPYEIGVTGSTAVEAARMVLSQHNGHTAKQEPAKSDLSNGLFVGLKDDDLSRQAGSELGFAIASLAHDHPELRIRVMTSTSRAGNGLLASILGSLRNVEVVVPTDYYGYLKLLADSTVVLTNSEDIAEEAIALSRPVLFMQKEPQLIDGQSEIETKGIASTQDSIVSSVEMAIAEHGKANCHGQASTRSPIGDGKASLRIVRLLNNWARNRVLTSHAFEPFDNRIQSSRAIQPELSTPLMQ